MRWLIVRITQVQPDAPAVAMDRGLPVLLEDLGTRKVAKALSLKFVDIGSLVLAAACNLHLAGEVISARLPRGHVGSGIKAAETPRPDALAKRLGPFLAHSEA